jgi:hypothetical protein
MTRFCALIAASLACMACSADQDQSPESKVAGGTGGCMAGAGGYLHAQLRGAVIADINWAAADMQCDGGPRPDGKGLRLTFAGKLPDSARQLRFIFGIDEHDIAAGAAQALPTNLTVILEGEQQLVATRGSERCAVESLERAALEAGGTSRYRVHARGYCLGPATSVAGDARLLVPTFEFNGIADAELAP